MPYGISLRDFFRLYEFARRRNRSFNDYFEFERFQGDLLVRYLQSKRVLNPNGNCLDLACGFGGYSRSFVGNCRQIVGLDLTPSPVEGVPMVTSDALKTPFGDESFHLVLCASLVEHLPDPGVLLDELYRLLIPGGTVYLSFPPYYSPRGGHQFSPYHLLGKRFALKMAQKRGVFKKNAWLVEKFPTRPASFEAAFGAWGLYPLTISKMRGYIARSHFNLIDQSTRWLPVDFSKVPWLGELLTWHVQFLLQKG